jgi:very-short-patch-repair endonuclease
MQSTQSLVVPLLCLVLLTIVALLSILIIVRLTRRTSTTPTNSGKPQWSPDQAALADQPRSDRPAPRSTPSPYAPIAQLLTPAERDFFAALQAAAPAGYQIFAQVRLAGLIQVKPQARRDKSHWWRIQAKCVDFVLCDARTTAPRLVIELDDSSHARADRQARDAFVDAVLADVGLPVLHVRWSRSYDRRDLAERIAGRLGLATPARLIPAGAQMYGGPGASPEKVRRMAATSRAAPSMAAAPMLGVALAIPSAPANSPAQPFVAAPASFSDPSAATHIACGQCYAAIRPEAKFCSCCGATLTA